MKNNIRGIHFKLIFKTGMICLLTLKPYLFINVLNRS